MANNFAKFSAATYHAAVLSLGRRGIDALVGAFAVLGFFYVPLGQHTGFEHAKAIFTTPAAKRAGRELAGAMLRVRDKLMPETRAHSASD